MMILMSLSQHHRSTDLHLALHDSPSIFVSNNCNGRGKYVRADFFCNGNGRRSHDACVCVSRCWWSHTIEYRVNWRRSSYTFAFMLQLFWTRPTSEVSWHRAQKRNNRKIGNNSIAAKYVLLIFVSHRMRRNITNNNLQPQLYIHTRPPIFILRIVSHSNSIQCKTFMSTYRHLSAI